MSNPNDLSRSVHTSNMKRILDKSNYDRQTIVTMELMSSYFVNIFYNELFAEAKLRKERKESPSITDGYKHALQAWLNGLEKPQLFKRIRKGLYDHYMYYYTVSWDTCTDRMVKEFIPNNYIDSLSLNQKYSILKMIITNSNKEFIRRIVFDHLPIIIDSHNADNAQALKDEMIGILLMEREQFFQRFIGAATDRHQSVNNNTERNLINQLENKIKLLLHEKYELTKRAINMKKIILKNTEELQRLRTQHATTPNLSRGSFLPRQPSAERRNALIPQVTNLHEIPLIDLTENDELWENKGDKALPATSPQDLSNTLRVSGTELSNTRSVLSGVELSNAFTSKAQKQDNPQSKLDSLVDTNIASPISDMGGLHPSSDQEIDPDPDSVEQISPIEKRIINKDGGSMELQIKLDDDDDLGLMTSDSY